MSKDQGSCGCSEETESMGAFLEYGDGVPSFETTIYNPITKKIDTYTYKPGKWTVLYFYPADFTFVCPTELGDLEEAHIHAKNSGVDFFSVSADSAYAHSIWHKTEPYLAPIKYPMMADTTKQIAEMFNLLDYATGFARRATVILNPKGEITVVEIVPDNMGRSTEELIRKIDALLFIEKNGGVCPVNWKSGQKNLDPAQLVIGDVFNSSKK